MKSYAFPLLLLLCTMQATARSEVPQPDDPLAPTSSEVVWGDLGAINGNTTAAQNLGASALAITSGTCEATPSTTSIQTDLAELTDNHYVGRVLIFTSGDAAGEATDITGYTGATGTLTVTALTTAPSASDSFVIL